MKNLDRIKVIENIQKIDIWIMSMNSIKDLSKVADKIAAMPNQEIYFNYIIKKLTAKTQ